MPSVVFLGSIAVVSLLLAKGRPSPVENRVERIAAARALALAVVVQSIHFVEELTTGFHERFPALFGMPSMSPSAFTVVNLVLIGVWVTSYWGLRSWRLEAFFAAWFLSIAGMINGVAHPMMAIAADGYFPGLVSSPFIGFAGVWLWVRLRDATRSKSAAAGGRQRSL